MTFLVEKVKFHSDKKISFLWNKALQNGYVLIREKRVAGYPKIIF